MDANITQSFIDMVEAYKAKPELEAQIKTLGEDNAMCYRTIDHLRYEIELLRNEKSDLFAKLSEVTKERDDASFRSLELDEKLSGIEKLLGLAERLEQARKAEHDATVAAMTPQEPPQQDQPDYTGPIDPVVVSGQSEADPISAPVSDPVTNGCGGASSAPTEPKINPYSGFPIHYPDGEYRGQPYYDKPSWISWAAFVDAGGEPEPYMQLVR